MTTTDFTSLITLFVERFRLSLKNDVAFRDATRSIAEAMLSSTEECPPPCTDLTDPSAVPVLVEEEPQVVVNNSDDNLSLIVARCRLKAQAARWAAERFQRLLADPESLDDIISSDRLLLAKAGGLAGCRLWMLGSFRVPEQLYLLGQLAGSFEVVADGADLLNRIAKQADPLPKGIWERAARLTAEAQSMLRVSVERVHDRSDYDQTAAFWRIRDELARRQIYLERYMRSEDPADPAAWEDLWERIAVVDDEFRKFCDQTKRQKEILNCIRYHAKLLEQGGSDHDLEKIATSTEELINAGVPPSNTDLRKAILPIAAKLFARESLPFGVRLLQREVENYLLISADDECEDPAPAPTAEVVQVRGLLRGKTVVLIGGDERLHAKEALQSAFGLGELVWVSTRPHQSIDTFEHFIKRPEVSVVLLAIRWSSHSFGDVKLLCDKWGKAFARIPAGYNSNQVATHILNQCGPALVATKCV